MKRKIFRTGVALLLVLMFSIPTFAAQMLIPVGRVVGLRISEGSVTVVAFDETLGAPAREAGLQIGDEIVSIDERQIDCAGDLQEALRCSDGAVTVTLSRDDDLHQIRVAPAATADGPKLGVYIREGVSGIGTITYFDPESGCFGALGHGVNDKHGQLCPMRTGSIYAAAVESVRMGQVGSPGQLKGDITDTEPIGTLSANTSFGIFGTGGGWAGEALPVAQPSQVTTGPARIITNVSGDQVDCYDVEIIRVSPSVQTSGRDLMLKVTDQRLLDTTGGIVAGMSGSPIIQDGKLVGAVTHVLVNDPTTGYGIFIENMLEAAG